ncbi:hypothetical protein [Baaleninema simplex]|uniref:hypothetical protein n=1 Tax=Baaleninema simplex TaxID=2862350 RepID=UPI0003493503|nr:hypothetical protein [Baaleninema simplex]
MTQMSLKWYKRLDFKLCLSAVLLAGGIMASFAVVLNSIGRRMVLTESAQLIQQTGENATATLEGRSREVAALTRSLAVVAAQLPLSEAEFRETIPQLIDFNGDEAIAGGGIWPEPYVFGETRERRAFFWGRNENGKLEYYDDYNAHESG